MDSESELELISLISQLLFRFRELDPENYEFISLVSQIISVVRSMDLNSQPKPETEFMSLITKAISVFYSMDFDSVPKPLSKYISLISQVISRANSMDSDSDLHLHLDLVKPWLSSRSRSWCPSSIKYFPRAGAEAGVPHLWRQFYREILALESEPELVSLIYQVFSLVTSMESKSRKFISLCPQKQVTSRTGKFHLSEEEVPRRHLSKWGCLPLNWLKFSIKGEDATRFYCYGCNGKNHEEYEKAPIEIKHHFHRKHSLQLVVVLDVWSSTGHCYCEDEILERVFYYCSACDFAIDVACPILLSIDHPKWHEHTLHLFPRHESLTCSLCAVADATSRIYMCPNCAFVVHLKCINLPRVIMMSRHRHRISFTHFLDHGDSSCGVCRRAINNDYGGYSCIKEGCSYAAHSGCATQSNVWDGIDLEGEPEEDMGEVEPFVRISDGIIQHFSHQHHHLKLDENTGRDYNDKQQCQVCITPIYFGNFYSCMQCDFILHEECANLSRKIYSPIHPHLLALECEHTLDLKNKCSACPNISVAGFLYKCGKGGCDFKLHAKCATISEPLVHESHIHPLFLTSKPEEEQRICSVCKIRNDFGTKETFNCIEECGFALCFECATLPHKVRYKHDKHILTLSYGKETSTMTYWCEVCEGSVDPQKQFYMCDEYCCLTLHIKCLLGKDLYMKPGSHFSFLGNEVHILPNNRHMTRPICSYCERRCSQKITVQFSGSITCSLACLSELIKRQEWINHLVQLFI